MAYGFIKGQKQVYANARESTFLNNFFLNGKPKKTDSKPLQKPKLLLLLQLLLQPLKEKKQCSTC